MILLALLAALWLRQRWAWRVSLLLDSFVVVSYAWDRTGLWFLPVNVLRLALLVSPPLRDYVWRRDLPPASEDR